MPYPPKKQFIKKKHSFLLLEVLIAFTLISLSFLPLMMPHLQMVKAQKENIDKMRIHLVSKYYCSKIFEKLYKNEISFKDIQEGKTFPLEEEQQNPFPNFTANFQIDEEKEKERDIFNRTIHLATLTLRFTSNKDQKTYSFFYKFPFGSQVEENQSENPKVDDDD